MPKRVLDFDAIWASDKLASCAPWARAEYAWIYGLADSNGSFELTNRRVIFGRVYAIRDDISLEQLSRVLDEFHAKGLLFVWEENGKKYGHWTGSDVPGRLPPPSWRARLERLAPPVPRAALAKYLSAFSSSRLKASPGAAQAQDLDSDLDLDREVEAAAAPSPANEIPNAEPFVNSPSGEPVFEHPRLRVSSQLDAKLAQEFPALPEPARRVEYERMAAKLEEAGESARHAGNYARAWLRGLSGTGASPRTQPVQRELWVGTAARPAEVGVSVKPAALERIRAREAAASGAVPVARNTNAISAALTSEESAEKSPMLKTKDGSPTAGSKSGALAGERPEKSALLKMAGGAAEIAKSVITASVGELFAPSAPLKTTSAATETLFNQRREKAS